MIRNPLLKKWQQKAIKDIARIVTGSTPSKDHPEYYGGNFPFVTPGDLDGGDPILSTQTTLTECGKSEVRVVPAGSVMVSCIGSLGKVGIAATELATNQQINSLIPDENQVCARYIYHYCKTLKPILTNMAPATTIAIVNKSRFGDILIPVPPLDEQRRISATLDKADAIRRKRHQVIDLISSLSGSLFLDMFGDPERNEKHWQRENFGSLGELDRGRSKHRPRNAPELYGGAYPFIQTGDVANCQGYIKEYQQTYSELGLQQSRSWKAGTLCITIAANIGKTGILTFDACFPDSVVGFTPSEKVTTEYIHYWLKFIQQRLERTAPESAQKNINLEILRKLSVPVPPIELQNKFSAAVRQVEKSSCRLNEMSTCVGTLFSSLSQNFFR